MQRRLDSFKPKNHEIITWAFEVILGVYVTVFAGEKVCGSNVDAGAERL